MNLRTAAACLLLALAIPSGRSRAEVASMGLAGAYGLGARGADAPSWNPATLAWDDGVDIRVFSARAALGNNSLTLGDYNELNGIWWGDAEKERILSLFPGSKLEGRGNVVVETLPTLAMDGWAFTVESFAMGRLQMPTDFLRLVLYGNRLDDGFQILGAEGEGMAWSEARLSHGWELEEITFAPLGAGPIRIAVGGSLKYLQGWGCAEVLRASGGMQTTLDGILVEETSLVARTATLGSGVGFDLGIAARTFSGWDLGITLRNPVGRIRFTGSPKEYSRTLAADTLTTHEARGGGDLLTTEESTKATSSFSRSVPGSLTFAVGREFLGNYLEADYLQGFSNDLGSSTNPRLALGLSRRQWGVLTGRLGLAAGGADGPVLGAGLGFSPGPVRLELAATAIGKMNFLAPKGVGGGVSLGLKL